jgi:hypothetical protein
MDGGPPPPKKRVRTRAGIGMLRLPMARRTRATTQNQVGSDVARRKRAATDSQPRPTVDTSAPRAIYLEACAAVGRHLSGRGFRYVRSGPRASRQDGDLTFEVQCQSSHHNVVGAQVTLWLHAHVKSQRLHDWRAAQGAAHPADYIGGGQLGNLRSEPSWLTWDLSEEATRAATVVNAIDAIERLAIPFFERFRSMGELAAALARAPVPGLEPHAAVELMLCFVGRDAARDAAAGYLASRPDLHDAFREALAQRTADPPASAYSVPRAFAPSLAYAALRFGLGELVPPVGQDHKE